MANSYDVTGNSLGFAKDYVRQLPGTVPGGFFAEK